MRSNHITIIAVAAAATSFAVAAPPLLPTQLIQENQAGLPGLGAETLTTISSIDAGGGGYAVRGVTSAPLDVVYGGINAASPGVLVLEGTYSGYAQTAIDVGASMNASGVVGYSAGGSSIDSIFKDTTLVVMSGDPAPDGGNFDTGAGKFFRAKIDDTGNVYYLGDAVNGFGVYKNVSQRLLGSGDSVTGVTGTVASVGVSTFDTSTDGSKYIAVANLTGGTGSAVVTINGTAAVAGGSPVGTGYAVLGSGTENWSTIRSIVVNNSGDYLVGASTNAVTNNDKLLISVGGSTSLLEEGTILPGQTTGLSGFINQTSINNNGDWAVLWANATEDLLIVNGEVILTESSVVDVDGDGVADAGTTISSMGVTTDLSISMTDRRLDGTFDIYFLGRTSTGGTSDTAFVVTIPEPASLSLLGLGALALGRRRRV